MSTRIRLRRMGSKGRPFYRVVVADQRSPRDGRFIENIGRYHPLNDPSVIEIDQDRALHWLRVGAQPEVFAGLDAGNDVAVVVVVLGELVGVRAPFGSDAGTSPPFAGRMVLSWSRPPGAAVRYRLGLSTI